MSNNNVISEKKKALLAYKEKILEEISYYEKTIDDFRTNHKNNTFYDDSSDSDADFLEAVNTGPTIIQLKQQQAMMKTCLQATQELTSLVVLQSEVNILVNEPVFEGEPLVAEAGTWREVTAECRIDLVPFTITFFMHTPKRKFGPTSYRGLRVVPVKSSHELELSKSVLHSLKLPSDAVEVIRSYAVGYRSRRTTLARLANKYTNALFMEPHPEGGFVMKCADLLDVSWRLQNKWSPVAPFHHRMKFDLEFMEESYIKIITQAHEQLLDPAIQTDERTLLLAKIITTCLEARGPIDPESDLESKTTERDNDIDKKDSDTEKRDSEVMAPPKSIPKKGKQKNKNSLTSNTQKRSLNDDNSDNGAKKMKNEEATEIPKTKIGDNSSNARKTKINDVVNEGAKKRKVNDVRDNVATVKNVKESRNTDIEDGNAKNKNVKEIDNNTDTKKNTNSKSNKNKITKEVDNANINTKSKTKVVKDTANTKTENKNNNDKPKEKVKESRNTDQGIGSAITKNKTSLAKTENKNSNEKLKENVVKESKNTDKGNAIIKNKPKESTSSNNKTKKTTSKDSGNIEDNNTKTKSVEKTKTKSVANIKSKENIDVNQLPKDVERPKSKTNVANAKNIKTNATKPSDPIKTKVKNVAMTKNDAEKKVLEKNIQSKEKLPEVTSKVTEKTAKVNSKAKSDSQTVTKVTEKNAVNIKSKDKISPINPVSEKNLKDKHTTTAKETLSEKVTSSNIVKKTTKEINDKKIIKEPIKTITHKIASHRNALKVQNPQKTFKTGNTKINGNTEKENGGKLSKIPQKRMTPIKEGSVKKNMLRISPRTIPSKFKSISQEAFKLKMGKSTNIPRLLKKPGPRTS